MINQITQLVQPRVFENIWKDEKLTEADIIVRPTYLSICHADQRYYRGTRDKVVMQEKLPMALIHEAIGEVQYDPLNEYSLGQKVVLIPNVPGFIFGRPKSKSVINYKIGENYCPQGKFRSSGFDGFMQELVIQPRKLIVPTHEFIEPSLFSLTEILSVCMHAFKRFLLYSNGDKQTIGVWGDGNVAFLMALLLRKILPDSKIIVFGKHPEKLELFSFIDEKYLIGEVNTSFKVDHVFECVGGVMQSEVLNTIIDLIEPGGSVSVLGVSEKKIEVNMRKVLEKGIILIGNSRSGTVDFHETVQFMKEDSVGDYLSLLATNVLTVRDIKDIHYAFELDSIKSYGKTLLKWDM